MDVTTSPDPEIQAKDAYPPRKVVIPALVAVFLAVFLLALDRTILGTAVPRISDEFQSFGDIAWYESGFLLPLCTLQLSFGLVYTIYSVKWVLIALVTIFEIGSIICAIAPSSVVLIVGRVISGVGAAGIISGALILINLTVPLRSRPKYSGGLGAVFGLASVIGPLAGGYLTAGSWRWCFWINVPIGAVSIIVLAILCPNPPSPEKPADTWLGKAKQLDPVGFILIAPGVVCLLFALQWGGTEYAWSDGRIIALFVVAGVLCLAFVASQVLLIGQRTIPPKIFLQRSILSGCIASIGIGSVIVVYSFYLPLWFQAIQGKSPEDAGLSLLPLLLSHVALVIVGGIVTSAFGYYTPPLILGGAVAIVGSALISTWEVDTGSGQWISYQIIAGVGLGLTLQGPNIAAQTVLPQEEAAIGITLLTFAQFLGGSVFVTVSQTLLEAKLVAGLEGKVPNINPGAIVNGGATTLRNLVPDDQLSFVLEVYNGSLKSIWYLGLALSCLIFVSSLGIEWKSVKRDEKKDAEEDTEEKKVGVQNDC